MTITIISGGQTGVDRAAMDFAMKYKILLSGYCPKGRKAEDGIIRKKYPLIELNDTLYASRTVKNVNLSDGILIIKDESTLGGGTMLTIDYAAKKGKPVFEYALHREFSSQILLFRSWLEQNLPCKLCIAGNRESQSPGIYLKTIKILPLLFEGYF